MTDSTEHIQEQLLSLSPYELEKVVAELWNQMGYETQVTSKSSDRGIDVDVQNQERNERKVIQVKQYSKGNRIGSPEIRKYATLYQQEDGLDEVILVTTSSYTKEAKILAHDLDVRIINGQKIAKLTQKYLPRSNKSEESPTHSDERPKIPANRIELSGEVPIGKHRKVESKLRKKIDPITGKKKMEVLGYEVEIISVTPRARATTPRSITKETSFYWS